jgi:hypothetical protein
MSSSLSSLVQKNQAVDALDAVLVAVHPVLRGAARARGRDDDALAGAPVGGAGDVERVCDLEPLDDAQQLVEVAAEAERVVQDRADDPGRVDDEHGAHGLGVGLAGHDHPVLVGDLHRDVPYLLATSIVMSRTCWATSIVMSSMRGKVTSTLLMSRKVIFS